ncbi:MAG: lipoprotein [Gammaproteobacteria bacterium]|nr:lipoprotein [Gammaproteobacteria bacterium]
MRHYLLIAISSLLLISCTGLSGCGQKGRLTMPPDKTAQENPATETPASQDDESREDDEREDQ